MIAALVITIVAVLLIWYTWTWTRKRLKPHVIVCVDNDVNRRILARCPRMRDYRLPFPYANPVIHSIISATFREHVPDLPKYFRTPVPLLCGAAVSIDFAADEVDPKKKTLLLLHGINGHSMASYCKHMVREATKRGYQCFLMNNRGCGGDQLFTAVTFNAARTSDVRQVVALIRSKYIDKETPLYMIGFSMGGTVLIRFLSQESGNRDLVQGAVAVSTNFNMDRTAAHMERPLSFSRHVLNRGFCLRMLRWFRRHEHMFRETTIDVKRVYSCRTLRAYDELVNVPTSEEFSTVAEYYAACSTDDKVGLVTCPLLCIQAEDDPICLAESIPIHVFRQNPNIIMNIVPSGGHVGFLEEVRMNSSSWIENCAMDYFDALEAERQQNKSPRTDSSIFNSTPLSKMYVKN